MAGTDGWISCGSMATPMHDSGRGPGEWGTKLGCNHIGRRAGPVHPVSHRLTQAIVGGFPLRRTLAFAPVHWHWRKGMTMDQGLNEQHRVNGADRKTLTWRFHDLHGALNAEELEPAHSPTLRVAMKERVAGFIRTYLQWSPLPLRTVWIVALVLPMVFVFTSFIGRTRLGTAPELFNWWQQAPAPFLNFFTWALLLPLVNRWSIRWSLKRQPVSPSILKHISLGLLLCTIHEVFTNVLYLILLRAGGQVQWSPEVLHGMVLFLPAGIVQRFLEYWLLLLLLMVVDSHRQVQEERNHVLRLKNELQATQLLALKKQLQPHFLFNTLNTVSALMDVDRKSARSVLARLGRLLRTTLDEERRETVSLNHELEYIGNYLGIETIRFKDRLQVKYQIDPECEQALLPGMLLQPLVENSIKHGLDASRDGVCVTITAERDKDQLHLQVGDNGKGCEDVHTVLANGGIGVRNVMERLALLHGSEGKFQVTSSRDQGFHVSIRIPFRTLETKAHEKHTDHRGG